jgi:hypothetical protein
VLEPTKQVADAYNAKLLVVHLQVPLVIFLLCVCGGFATVVAIAGVVVVKEKVEAEGQFMALLETPRDQAHVFETFFVQVLNKETKDTLVVGPDIQQTVPVRVVRLEFIHYFFCQRVQADQTNVVNIFATREFIC